MVLIISLIDIVPNYLDTKWYIDVYYPVLKEKKLKKKYCPVQDDDWMINTESYFLMDFSSSVIRCHSKVN